MSGSSIGTVKVRSAAIVPDGPIDLRNTQTNENQSAESNAEGGYRFMQLKPGSYDVTVAGKNFAKYIAFIVGVGQNVIAQGGGAIVGQQFALGASSS